VTPIDGETKSRTAKTAAATSAIYPLNWRQQDFQVSLALAITGTVNVTVQHTFDGLHGEYVTAYSGLTWFPHSTLASKTASADGNYAFPVTAIRITVTAYTSGSVTFTVIQAGY
jgi:hypothetical protein